MISRSSFFPLLFLASQRIKECSSYPTAPVLTNSLRTRNKLTVVTHHPSLLAKPLLYAGNELHLKLDIFGFFDFIFEISIRNMFTTTTVVSGNMYRIYYFFYGNRLEEGVLHRKLRARYCVLFLVYITASMFRRASEVRAKRWPFFAPFACQSVG